MVRYLEVVKNRLTTTESSQVKTMCDDLKNAATKLISTLPIEQNPPWCSLDDRTIKKNLRDLVQSIITDIRIDSHLAFDDYGSGYASFGEAWFFRKDASFARNTHANPLKRLFGRRRFQVKHYTGLVVLFCKMAPVYCLFEGEKGWGNEVSSSYLPTFENIDVITSDAVRKLSFQIETYLKDKGYFRLDKKALSSPVPEEIAINTNLSNPPYRNFDLLFHWED